MYSSLSGACHSGPDGNQKTEIVAAANLFGLRNFISLIRTSYAGSYVESIRGVRAEAVSAALGMLGPGVNMASQNGECMKRGVSARFHNLGNKWEAEQVLRNLLGPTWGTG